MKRLPPFLAVTGLLLGVTASAQVVTINQSFTGATAPGWVFGAASGSTYTPTLTAAPGGPDAVGSGWLQMTSAGTNEATYAYDPTSFASANTTISAQFNYVSYGGTGADGITFFLADASQPFSVGAYGGSLGYAQKTLAGGAPANINGMSGGYLGLGIDEFGNYSNPTEGRVYGTGFTPDAIAVRGPGSGLTGYDYLGGTSSLSQPISYPSQSTRPSGSEAETIQITLTATNQLSVSIAFGGTGTFTQIFTANLAGYARPNNLIMGFTAGTGSATDIHAIQNVLLSSIAANLWTNGASGNNWTTANDWYGSPAVVPTASSDVLLNNAYVSTAQTINVDGTGGQKQVIRSLQIDAPFAYTLSTTNGGVLEFNNGGITGPTGIIVTNANGTASHVIGVGIQADNAMVIQNNTASSLAVTGPVNTNGNSISFTGSGAVAVSGVVSGSGSLIQGGTGSTTLTSTNSYTGGTTLSSGTLNANASGALGTGALTLQGGTLTSTASISNAITLSGNATLSGTTTTGALTQTGGSYTLTMASNATHSGTIALAASGSTTVQNLSVQVDSGTASLNGIISNGGTTANGLYKEGAGTLTLGAVNTYTGTTQVDAGTLTLGVSNAIASASAVNLNTGTLNLNGKSDTVGALSFTNGAIDFGTAAVANYFIFNSIASGTGILTVSNWASATDQLGTNASVSAYLNQLYFSGYGSGSVQSGLTTLANGASGYIISPGATFITWNGLGGNSNWNTSGNWVSGTGGPPTTGSTTQKIDFTGATSLTPTLNANYSANAIKFDSNATGSFTISGSTRTLTLAGTVPSIIDQSSVAQQISTQKLTFNANGVIDVSGSQLTISSALTGTGNITKLSNGTLILSGPNGGYSGNFAVQGGTLSVSNASSALGTGSTTVSSGATLAITGAMTLPTTPITLSGVGYGGNGALESTAAGSTNLGGVITLAADSTINTTAGTLTMSGGITSTGSTNLTLNGAGNTMITSAITTNGGGVTVNSTGTTTFSGANTYTGATTVNSGATLKLSGGGTSTTVAGNLVVNGGAVSTTSSGNFSSNTAVTLNGGSLTFAGSATSETISSLAGSAGTTVALGANNSLTIAGPPNTVFSGTLTGGASSSLTKNGGNVLALGGVNSGFAGSVTVNSGTLQTNVAGALNSANAITVNTSAILNLNDFNQTVATVNGAGTINLGTTGNEVLTLSSTTGTSYLTGALTGSGTIVVGAGATLSLGANFNDPNINIDLAGGTLLLNGTTDVFGHLSLTGTGTTSTIDFANGLASSLTVSGYSATAGDLLNVTHWTNASDYFYSTSNPGTQGAAPLNQINFGTPYTTGSTHWQTGAGGTYEITPAPEPATYGAILTGLSLGSLLVIRRRQRGPAA